MNRRNFLQTISILGASLLLPLNVEANNKTKVIKVEKTHFKLKVKYDGDTFVKFVICYTYKGTIEEIKKHYKNQTILLYEEQGGYIRGYVIPQGFKLIDIIYE